MIKKATASYAMPISVLMVAAMGDLANKFRASPHQSEVLELFERFIGLSNNQYSFENTLVYTEKEEIIGSITAYDGSLIAALREPFLNYIKANYHSNGFEIEEETETGEYYIDTLAVDPKHQGKGIGRDLIAAVLDHAQKLGHQKVALLVSIANPDAKKLYEKIGFVKVGERYLLGSAHEHLVYQL